MVDRSTETKGLVGTFFRYHLPFVTSKTSKRSRSSRIPSEHFCTIPSINYDAAQMSSSTHETSKRIRPPKKSRLKTGSSSPHKRMAQERLDTGATIAELIAGESFAPQGVYGPEPESDIESDCPIHDVFARERWQNELPAYQALYPMRDGSGEYWDTRIERIHTALQHLAPPPVTDLEDEEQDVETLDTPAAFDRYEKVKEYRISRRRLFAFDTMWFSMGEHILLAHVRKQGEIALTAEDFRALLKICTKKELFRWTEINYPPLPTLGSVERITNGWPTTPLTPLDIPIVDKVTHHRWDMYLDEARDKDGLYVCWTAEGQYDFDMEILRHNMNLEARRLGERELTKEDFRSWLWTHGMRTERLVDDREGETYFVFGSPGIIRSLEENDNGAILRGDDDDNDSGDVTVVGGKRKRGPEVKSKAGPKRGKTSAATKGVKSASARKTPTKGKSKESGESPAKKRRK
ncbi:hypothetical protein B0J14DRAFT_700335 [Halenospora varia]|nr:hypothetical protein B0J14DRAFT_700335 [Halenospora varia]